MLGADRAHRAGKEGLIGLMYRPFIGRLLSNCGETTDILKARRRQLPAGITINTGRIDVEVADNVGVESFCLIGHGATSMR